MKLCTTYISCLQPIYTLPIAFRAKTLLCPFTFDYHFFEKFVLFLGVTWHLSALIWPSKTYFALP